MVRLHDDDSHYGEGECAPLPDLSCDALPEKSYASTLASFCEDLCHRGTLDTEALRNFPSMLFGLETAWLSLLSVRAGGSRYRLFDTPFTRGEAGIPINGLVWMGSHEEMLQRMEEKLAAGFRCIKIKIGAIDFRHELDLLRRLRLRFGPDTVQLRVDANGAFSPEQTWDVLRQLAPYGIHSIEQPIRAGNWEAMGEICRQSPVPIALDEELIGVNHPAAKAELLDAVRPHFLVLKPSLHGGISGSEEWIRLARQRGIGYWVTSALESNCGLNAIASWVSSLPPFPAAGTSGAMWHQGLGTGSLYVRNIHVPGLHLDGQMLWREWPEDVAFRHEAENYRKQWTDDAARTIVVHTSGSTGQPKALHADKRSMRESACRTLSALRVPHGATALLCMPLRYIAAQMMVVRSVVWPLRLECVHPSSHPMARVDEIPYFVAMTPMQAWNTLHDPDEAERLRQVKVLLLGGGEITPSLRKLLQSCKGDVWSSYGMTETLSNVALCRLNGAQGPICYEPFSGVEIACLPLEKETEDMQAVVHAETLRSPCVGRLVIFDPVTQTHPLLTNDVGNLHPDGSFEVWGRIDNVICSGGIKLQMEQLERKLQPFLSRPFFLTSSPDPCLGQALTLVYETAAPDDAREKESIEQLCHRVLPRTERPRHYRAVNRLPVTETGKPLRFADSLSAAATSSENNSEQTEP